MHIILILQYIDTLLMYHNIILSVWISIQHICEDFLKHVCYEVNADGSMDNSAGKEAEVNPDSILTLSGTS